MINVAFWLLFGPIFLAMIIAVVVTRKKFS